MAFLSYSLATMFGCTGLYKLWVYTPMEEDIYGDMIAGANAIVGGDAYNYIINGTHAVAYILLALIFVIVGSVIVLNNNSKTSYFPKQPTYYRRKYRKKPVFCI